LISAASSTFVKTSPGTKRRLAELLQDDADRSSRLRHVEWPFEQHVTSRDGGHERKVEL
jgi:hypothetical protein